MAQDYFLKIDGIDGESTDDKHRGEIELDSWSFGGSHSATLQGGGRAGTGKFDAQNFHFTATISKASPKLFEVCATGQHFKSAAIVARKAGDRPVEYLKITLTNVVIASYQQSAASGTSVPIDQVSLSYTKIQIEYREMKSDGSFGGSVTGGFDVKANSRV